MMDRVMNREFKDALEDSPVIAAIKDDNGLKECLKSDIQVVFILYGDICNIADIVDTVKQAGKMALVHLGLINGLSAKDVAVDFIKKYTKADGIISTKPALIKPCRRDRTYIGVAFICHRFHGLREYSEACEGGKTGCH